MRGRERERERACAVCVFIASRRQSPPPVPLSRQRLSVVASDVALIAAAWAATRHLKGGGARALAFGLVFAR